MNKIEVVKRILDKFPSPAKGLVIDLVDYDSTEPVVYLRFYRENFDSLPESVRQDIANEWVPFIIGTASKIGVGVLVEAEEYVPNWEGKK